MAARTAEWLIILSSRRKKIRIDI